MQDIIKIIPYEFMIMKYSKNVFLSFINYYEADTKVLEKNFGELFYLY